MLQVVTTFCRYKAMQGPIIVAIENLLSMWYIVAIQIISSLNMETFKLT